jgi:hypothetical protein
MYIQIKNSHKIFKINMKILMIQEKYENSNEK